MKQIYLFTLSILFGISSLVSEANITMEEDSVSMGASYVNDVYYSFADGEVLSVERQNWEIGFYTSIFSAAIITNGGAGVDLYTYKNGDTTNWNDIDTTGFSSWPVLYNSTEEWEDGAFNRNALGHPDYGWGIYNTVTNNVVGDSLYIIKYFYDEDSTIFKKLWIEKKASMLNIYYFKYADLNGDNEVSVELSNNDYSNKHFVYYSLLNEEVLDREPDMHSWDILFTKYITEYLPGVTYSVTGVLNNIDIPANKFEQVGDDFEEWDSAPMDSTKSPIGYEWKQLDGWSYVIVDSLAYFARNKNQHVYKMVFTGFDGMSTGNIYFNTSMVYVSAIDEMTENSSFLLYPNPANEYVNIRILEGDHWEKITISDVSGRVVYKSNVINSMIPTVDLSDGLYIVSLSSQTETQVQKLMIKNN